MDVVVLVGRIVLGLFLFYAGISHLTKLAVYAGFTEAMGVRPAKTLVAGTGVQLLAAGVMVILGVWLDLGALLAIAFLVPAAVLMHPYWKAEGEMAQTQQAHFGKNIALAGAALMILGLSAALGDDLGLTITGPLF